MEDIVLIEIEAWQLLLVPFFLGCSLFVIAMIMKSSSNDKERANKEEKEKEKTFTGWIKKKDILYWLLLFCLGAISLFTYQYSGDKNVISHWGFAGTIVSIILAVVAIGFTLFQTLSSNLSSEKIAEAAFRIESVSKNLDYKRISESSEIMNKSATYLKEQIPLIKNEIEELKKGQEIQNSKLGLLDDYFDTNQNNSTAHLLSLESYFSNVFPELGLVPQVLNYAFLNSIYLNIDLSKEDKNKLYRILADVRISDGMTNAKEKWTYVRGANMGSAGSVQAYLTSLGINKMFEELKSSDQKEFISLMENSLKENIGYLNAVEKFLADIGSKTD
ncbi:hypothetical protein [Lysinibacillus sp. FSL W8-0992]|uniref:hypothetical protein n=1 Tax=Lysinibacillus sp. FSL W8-0992 TaxID=2954643 RepID=UPI0030F97726